MSVERIAVVAIHGVADQAQGKTAQDIAALLLSSTETGRYYSPGTPSKTILAVPPLSPMAKDDATTLAMAPKSLGKAFRQSVRSDFQRPDWAANAGAPVHPTPTAAAKKRTVNQLANADSGIAASDYLLNKAHRSGMGNETYEVSTISLSRVEKGNHAQVDVHEMYWADLSRLSGSVPRILTELFTLMFRLSRLGRDTVDEAAREASRHASLARCNDWNDLADTQIALDWVFSTILSNLVLQLLVAGSVIAGLGIVAPSEDSFRRVLAWALPMGGCWWVCYMYCKSNISRVVIILVGIAVVWISFWLAPHWVVGGVWLGFLVLACDRVLRIADERFPAIRAVGLVILSMMVAIIVGQVIQERVLGEADIHSWIRAGMYAVEVLLVAVVVLWASIAVIGCAWLYYGYRVSQGSAAERASVATGRLGLFASMATFVALTMALWALLTMVVELGAANTSYQPHIFTFDCCNAQVCPRSFLRSRYENSTETFAPIAGLSVMLLIFLVVMLAPSIFAEAGYKAGTSGLLGRWLSAGYRWLDRFVAALVVLAGVVTFSLAAVLLFGLFRIYLLDQFTEAWRAMAELSHKIPEPLVISAAIVAATLAVLSSLLTSYAPKLRGRPNVVLAGAAIALLAAALLSGFFRLNPPVDFSGAWRAMAELSHNILKPLIISAATATAALSAFGGVLARWAPGLRAPLDVALDVDNHFREFPRRMIPRARIFSRYVALLESLAAAHYDRIVIVAHSQGTVITTELLRYLQYRAAVERGGRVDALWNYLDRRMKLLTAGCPLRQLYAARFPFLYSWITENHNGRSGPRAQDVGVNRWINVYTSGDYVGRWLWCDAASNNAALGSDSLFYAAHQVPEIPSGAEVEACLGAGAHTHYFDSDQHIVAGFIDRLVRAA